MTTKVFNTETAEALIAGTESAPCVKCGESRWAKAQPALQTKRIGFLKLRCRVCHSKTSAACGKARYATDEEYREYHKAAGLAWQKDNRGKANSHSAKRRSKKLQATPPWSDLAAVQEFYTNCPPGMHVDHIIPLQGRKVSGLHLLDNLQYLTAFENLSKSNSFKDCP